MIGSVPARRRFRMDKTCIVLYNLWAGERRNWASV